MLACSRHSAPLYRPEKVVRIIRAQEHVEFGFFEGASVKVFWLVRDVFHHGVGQTKGRHDFFGEVDGWVGVSLKRRFNAQLFRVATLRRKIRRFF